MERIIDKLSKKNIIEEKKFKAEKIVNRIKKLGYILSFIGAFNLSGGYLNSSYQNNKQYNIVNSLINRNLPTSDKAAFNFLQKDPNLINKFPDNNFKKLKNLKRVVLDNNYIGQKDSTGLEKVANAENQPNISGETKNNLILMSGFDLIYEPNAKTLYKYNAEKDSLEGKLEEVIDVSVLPGYVYFVQGKEVFRKPEQGNFERVWKADSAKCRFAKIWGTDFGVIFDNKIRVLEGYDSLKNMIEYFEIDSLLKKSGKFDANYLNRVIYKNNTLYIGGSGKIFIISKNKNYQVKPSDPGLFSDYLVLDIDNDGKDEIVASDKRILSKDQYRIYKEGSLAYYLRYIDNLEFDYNAPVSEDFKLLMNPNKLKKQIMEKLKENE